MRHLIHTRLAEAACTCSRLVIDPSRIPKNSTPVIWTSSMTALSAFVTGRMSPKPMVATVVRDQ